MYNTIRTYTHIHIARCYARLRVKVRVSPGRNEQLMSKPALLRLPAIAFPVASSRQVLNVQAVKKYNSVIKRERILLTVILLPRIARQGTVCLTSMRE